MLKKSSYDIINKLLCARNMYIMNVPRGNQYEMIDFDKLYTELSDCHEVK